MLRGVYLRSTADYAKWFKVSCILHNTCIAAGAASVAVPPERNDRYTVLAGSPHTASIFIKYERVTT
jgi:hypothetical protein